MSTNSLKVVAFAISTLLAKSVLALSLHVCANGLYYITPLNSNGTVAGPTVLAGACSGGDWACTSELVISSGGTGGHHGAGVASDQVINHTERLSIESLEKMKIITSGNGLIVGNARAGYSVVGYRKVFTPEKLVLDGTKLNPLATGFLAGFEISAKK
jgi:hypothetical protein